MAYNKYQLQDFITRTLLDFSVFSGRSYLSQKNAVYLLMGTMAVESDFGTYLRQTIGPALGAYQMEPDTFRWLIEKYSKIIPPVFRYCQFKDLEYDLYLSTIMARLRYCVDPEPIPDYRDIEGQGKYWKKNYNTYAKTAKGTVKKFIQKHKKYIGRVE